MIIKIRDRETREMIKMINRFISFIWTERFNTYGDFELQVPLTSENIDLFKMDYYLEIPTSDRLMIIEKLEIKDQTLKITGRSLESILDRRIMAQEYVTSTSGVSPLGLINTILNDQFLNSSEPDRRIEYLKIRSITENINAGYDPNKNLLKKYTVSRGDNIYDLVVALLLVEDMGYRITFDPVTLNFEYASYDGFEKSNIVFSESNYNLSNPTYKEDMTPLKTTAYVAGEGEGTKRKIVTLSRSTIIQTPTGEQTSYKYKGIFRREMWVDARDIQQATSEKNADYTQRLKDRGIEKMAEKNKEYTVDGEIIDSGRYKLGYDYTLGDTVILQSKIYKAKAKIMEVIQSWDSSGYKIYPTFNVVEVDKPEIDEKFNLD